MRSPAMMPPARDASAPRAFGRGADQRAAGVRPDSQRAQDLDPPAAEHLERHRELWHRGAGYELPAAGPSATTNSAARGTNLQLLSVTAIEVQPRHRRARAEGHTTSRESEARDRQDRHPHARRP